MDGESCRRPFVSAAPVRKDALHVFGVNLANTIDLKRIFKGRIKKVEWLDDYSVNIVFQNSNQLSKCVLALHDVKVNLNKTSLTSGDTSFMLDQYLNPDGNWQILEEQQFKDGIRSIEYRICTEADVKNVGHHGDYDSAYYQKKKESAMQKRKRADAMDEGDNADSNGDNAASTGGYADGEPNNRAKRRKMLSQQPGLPAPIHKFMIGSKAQHERIQVKTSIGAIMKQEQEVGKDETLKDSKDSNDADMQGETTELNQRRTETTEKPLRNPWDEYIEANEFGGDTLVHTTLWAVEISPKIHQSKKENQSRGSSVFDTNLVMKTDDTMDTEIDTCGPYLHSRSALHWRDLDLEDALGWCEKVEDNGEGKPKRELYRGYVMTCTPHLSIEGNEEGTTTITDLCVLKKRIAFNLLKLDFASDNERNKKITDFRDRFILNIEKAKPSFVAEYLDLPRFMAVPFVVSSDEKSPKFPKHLRVYAELLHLTDGRSSMKVQRLGDSVENPNTNVDADAAMPCSSMAYDETVAALSNVFAAAALKVPTPMKDHMTTMSSAEEDTITLPSAKKSSKVIFPVGNVAIRMNIEEFSRVCSPSWIGNLTVIKGKKR